jgi:hypothetical protein
VFERWTDILAAAAGVVGVAYMAIELSRRQRKLRELFDVLGGEDARLTNDLTQLVDSGQLLRYSPAAEA